MGDVKEGFLCPICMSDLGDVIQLQVHFEEKHSKEDPAILKNIKELFGKAKKKILNEEEDEKKKRQGDRLAVPAGNRGARSGSSSPKTVGLFGPKAEDLDFHPVSGVPKHLLIENPSPPPLTSHWDLFRGERKKRLDRNKSANQILVRLEKLLKDLPSEPGRRRAHEQAVVPWISEDLVSRCPTCARSFNLARRKHHCRLCGSIMCKDCSASVPLDFARRVVNPASIARFKPEPEEAASEDTPSKKKGGGKFKLSGSHESLNKLMNIMELKGGSGEEAFRSCVLCRSILEKQEERSEVAASEPPMLVLLYTRLQDHMREGRELSSKYLSVHGSLTSGETDHDLEEAKVLRVRLLKVGEAVDVVSKRIELLNTDPEGERMATRAEMKLQMRVRTGAVNFVKTTLVSLPGLPSEEDVERYKIRRKEDAKRKVVKEREAAKRAKEKFEQHQVASPDGLGTAFKAMQSNVTSTLKSQSSQLMAHAAQVQQAQADRVHYGQGFVLSSSAGGANGAGLTASEDPMVQQIHNIRSYILEARRMGRYEEVATLEENLKDLQAEYQRMQEERLELEQNFNSFKGIFHKTSPMVEQPGQEPKEEPSPEGEEIPDMDEYDASGKNPFA